MMAWFEACVSFGDNQYPETCPQGDFEKADGIIGTWFSDGKLQATGYAFGFNDSQSDTNMRLKQECGTIDLDYQDYITLMLIKSGEHGIEQLDIQTAK
jgi:hypothetical protein